MPSGLITKLVVLASRHGHLGNVVPPPYSHDLGLAAAGHPWLNYSVGLRSAGGQVHSFQIGIGGSSDVLFTAREPKRLAAYRAHRNQILSCAIGLDITRHRAVMLEPAKAKAGYAAEIALWSANIDAINAGKVKIATFKLR